jgi:hypothetical protein
MGKFIGIEYDRCKWSPTGNPVVPFKLPVFPSSVARPPQCTATEDGQATAEDGRLRQAQSYGRVGNPSTSSGQMEI